MKAKIIPIYFESAEDGDFVNQVNVLRELLKDQAEILNPMALGADLPEVDGVVFPQMLGAAYRRWEQIVAIRLPVLVITSEFGTESMWDWEINAYLRSRGKEVLAPYSLEQARVICRALGLKRKLQGTKVLVYQDNPGEGFQAEIFKRFYWWEAECTQRIRDRFGVEIIKHSFRDLAQRAKAISDEQAHSAWDERQETIPIERLSQSQILSAMKLFLALRNDLEADPTILAAGINCLNESFFSDTLPCLAWDLLFEEHRLLWGCEADTLSMLTELLVHCTLGTPVMMTNLYPNLMGQAALKHEHIPNFPEVVFSAENQLLAAHCGYLGVMPRSFATDWCLRKKVLAIVDENSVVIDARFPTGPVTLVKLDATLQDLVVTEGVLEGYAQFPGSHCLNGAIVRIGDGYRFMEELVSHHTILAVGQNLVDYRNLARVFGLTVRLI